MEVSEGKKGLVCKIDDNHAKRLGKCVQELLEPQQNQEQTVEPIQNKTDPLATINIPAQPNDSASKGGEKEYRSFSAKEKKLLTDMLDEFRKDELEELKNHLGHDFDPEDSKIKEDLLRAAFKASVRYLRKNKVKVNYNTEVRDLKGMLSSLEINTDVTQKFIKCAEEFLA